MKPPPTLDTLAYYWQKFCFLVVCLSLFTASAALTVLAAVKTWRWLFPILALLVAVSPAWAQATNGLPADPNFAWAPVIKWTVAAAAATYVSVKTVLYVKVQLARISASRSNLMHQLLDDAEPTNTLVRMFAEAPVVAGLDTNASPAVVRLTSTNLVHWTLAHDFGRLTNGEAARVEVTLPPARQRFFAFGQRPSE